MASDETTIVIKGDSKNAQNSINSLNKSLEGISKTAATVAKASGAVFAGLSGVGVLAVRSFGKFENKMLAVKTLLDDDTFADVGQTLAEGFEDMSDRTLAAFSKMPIALDSATGAMFDLVSAGVKASKATKVLGSTAKLAVAGMTNIKISTDGVTSVMNAYGKSATEAEEISGKFFLAQKFGKTTIEELASGFGKVGSAGAAMNISFEEVLSSVSALTLGGIKTAEAYTGLKAIMTGISVPTAAAAEEAERLGINFSAAGVRSKGLGKFLKELAGNTKFTKDSITKLFGSSEAQTAMFALMGDGAQKFGEILAEVNDDVKASTTLNEAYEKQVGSFSNQVQILSNKFETLSIQIGKKLAPLFKDMVDWVSKAVDWFINLDEITKDMIVKAGLFATATAGIVAGLSTFAAVLPTLLKGLAMIRTAIAGVSAVMAANPIGAALLIAVTGVTLLASEWDKSFDKMEGRVKQLSDTMEVEFIKQRTLKERLDRFFLRGISDKKRFAEQDLEDQKKRLIKNNKIWKEGQDKKNAISAEANQKRLAKELKAEEDAAKRRLDNQKKFQADVAAGDEETRLAAENRADIALNESLVREREARIENANMISGSISTILNNGMEGVISTGLGMLTDTFLPGFGGAVSQMFNFLAQDSESFVNQINQMFSVDFLNNIADNIAILAEKLPEIIPPFVEEFVQAMPRISAAMIEAFNDPEVWAKLIVGVAQSWYKGLLQAYLDVFKRIENALHFEPPEWLKDLEELVNKLTGISWDFGAGKGGSFGFKNSPIVTGISAIAGTGVTTPAVVEEIASWFSKGKNPAPMYMRDGFSPRGMDNIPAMIDPRERILSHSSNVDLMRAISDIKTQVSNGTKVVLEFTGTGGAVEFVEGLLVSANAIGTGRIDVGVASEG